MDKLTRTLIGMFIVAVVVALVGLGGGGYMLHTAINDGNFWKGLVGAVFVVIGVKALAVIVMARG